MVSVHLSPVASDVVSKATEKFHSPITVTVTKASVFSKLKALVRDKFLVGKTPSSCRRRSLGNKEIAAVSELLQIVRSVVAPLNDTNGGRPHDDEYRARVGQEGEEGDEAGAWWW